MVGNNLTKMIAISSQLLVFINNKTYGFNKYLLSTLIENTTHF